MIGPNDDTSRLDRDDESPLIFTLARFTRIDNNFRSRADQSVDPNPALDQLFPQAKQIGGMQTH